MAGTHPAAELAARAGIPLVELERHVVDAGRGQKASGPNRAARRAIAKAVRRAR